MKCRYKNHTKKWIEITYNKVRMGERFDFNNGRPQHRMMTKTPAGALESAEDEHVDIDYTYPGGFGHYHRVSVFR